MSDIILWRYLTFEQLEDMLDTSTLFFTHRDKITEYEEGRLPDNIENQYKDWTEKCFRSIKMMNFLMGVKTVVSTYKCEDIVQGEIEKTKLFVNNTYFVCFRKDTSFSLETMKNLNKHLAIKISFSKLSKYWEKIGVYNISSDIYYVQNRNNINALERLSLLLNVPSIWENEQEFRILLPLLETSEECMYKMHLAYLQKEGISPENDDEKDLYMSFKKYSMVQKLRSQVIEDENSYGVKVPFDTKIIDEIYVPEDQYYKYWQKYPNFRSKFRKFDS